MKEPILLTPGPLTTSTATKLAMVRDWGSRDTGFIQLNRRVREMLLDVVKARDTHVCVPLQGSGTFAVEAMLYRTAGLIDTMRTLDTGWFAKKDVFAYLRPEPPEYGPGGDAWLESTPPVLAPVQALAGLELTLELGVERLRAHNLEQKKQLSDLLFRNGVETLGVGEDFGAFLTVRDERAPALVERLRRLGVIADARGDALRLCPDLLNSGEELERAAKIIGAAVREG